MRKPFAKYVYWDGPPGTSPGAEVEFTIDVNGLQGSWIGCYGFDEDVVLNLYSEGGGTCDLVFGAVDDYGGLRVDQSSRSTDILINGDLICYQAQEYWNLPDYPGEPDFDENTWKFENEYCFEISDSLAWEYNTMVIYEVPSTVTVFEVGFNGWCETGVISFLDYDSGFGPWVPETWIQNSAKMEIHAECYIE